MEPFRSKRHAADPKRHILCPANTLRQGAQFPGCRLPTKTVAKRQHPRAGEPVLSPMPFACYPCGMDANRGEIARLELLADVDALAGRLDLADVVKKDVLLWMLQLLMDHIAANCFLLLGT